MPLAADRNTPVRPGQDFVFPVATNIKIYAGALVALNATGYLTKGAASTTLIGVGRAEEQVDNTGGADGAKTCKISRGVFRWANSAGGDEITKAEIGDACYIVDDQTVAKTDGGGTRSKAGIIADVDANGVWVNMGVETLNSPAAALLAANNLSDVANAGTSRDNLGVYEKMGAPAFVIGAEAANVINVGIQLKDSAGVDLAVRGSIFAYLSGDAEGDDIVAAAPDGGVAIGADGVLIPVVADKAFQLVSEVDGDIDINITHAAGAKTVYLILVMPDGRLVASNAITFA